MRKYLDALMAWLHPKLVFLPKLGGGIYWTLPFGNDGRGTRVYLWPFVGFALIMAAIVFYDTVIR